MQEYVLIYFYDFIVGSYVLLEKEKPDYQQGRYNLPGGKVEPGETPKDAALREFWEETGIQLSEVEKYGEIRGDDFIVHVFNGSYFGNEDVKLKTTDYEQPFWGGSKYFLEREKFMPNLQVIIPLMEYHLRNWVIYDNGPSEIGKPHTFSITVNTDD